jgi:hypothetical protein
MIPGTISESHIVSNEPLPPDHSGLSEKLIEV